MKPWLTIPEAAALVGKHTRAIYRWISAGKLETATLADGSTAVVKSGDVLRVDAEMRPGRPRTVQNAE